MLSIGIILRKIGALSSPLWFVVTDLITVLSLLQVGQTRLLSVATFYYLPFQGFHLLTPFIPYIMYKKQLFILIFTNKKLPTGRAWKRIPIRHLQSNTNYPLNES